MLWLAASRLVSRLDSDSVCLLVSAIYLGQERQTYDSFPDSHNLPLWIYWCGDGLEKLEEIERKEDGGGDTTARE